MYGLPKICVCCDFDSSVHLDVPSIGMFVYVRCNLFIYDVER